MGVLSQSREDPVKTCRLAAAAFVTLIAAGCASTPPAPPAATPPAAAVAPAPAPNLAQERQIIGTENGVRVEARVRGEALKEASNITVNYDIINERSSPVAVADIVPISTYDPELRTLTLEIGSEVPGEQFLPRLLVIPPGGRRAFRRPRMSESSIRPIPSSRVRRMRFA